MPRIHTPLLWRNDLSDLPFFPVGAKFGGKGRSKPNMPFGWW